MASSSDAESSAARTKSDAPGASGGSTSESDASAKDSSSDASTSGESVSEASVGETAPSAGSAGETAPSAGGAVLVIARETASGTAGETAVNSKSDNSDNSSSSSSTDSSATSKKPRRRQILPPAEWEKQLQLFAKGRDTYEAQCSFHDPRTREDLVWLVLEETGFGCWLCKRAGAKKRGKKPLGRLHGSRLGPQVPKACRL